MYLGLVQVVSEHLQSTHNFVLYTNVLDVHGLSPLEVRLRCPGALQWPEHWQ